uniref:Uncharacterized protein n=2 Tax=unclassified Caudoviricetes TaxID=2788787 RepID=A0A8S5PJ21_9CAUD|nr:MAG TPA: hypothetical protein [Siphoviridae sp. ctJcm18]DAE06597.1 MAG TPA: hypothetical protein [Siphoviridae sp. ctUGQ45]
MRENTLLFLHIGNKPNYMYHSVELLPSVSVLFYYGFYLTIL